MSEISQGPGWWQASDGRWYPPSPVRKTNGLAVASFVLSLLWIGGLGSLLSVIFGISSRRSIKRSQGQETGKGFATAGLIIGILGILGSLVVYSALVTVSHGVSQSVHQVITPQVAALGHPLNVSASSSTGISTVTVYSVTYPVKGAGGYPSPIAGKVYAAADIQVCAGSSGSQNGPDSFSFSLLFQNGQSVGVSSNDLMKQPNLFNFNGIGANKCVRGFLAFDIATGTIPTKAQYWPDPFHNYEWALTR